MNVVDKCSTLTVLASSPLEGPLRGRTTRLGFCTSQKSTLPREVGGTFCLRAQPYPPYPPTPALPLKGGGREKHERVEPVLSWIALAGMRAGLVQRCTLGRLLSERKPCGRTPNAGVVTRGCRDAKRAGWRHGLGR